MSEEENQEFDMSLLSEKTPDDKLIEQAMADVAEEEPEKEEPVNALEDKIQEESTDSELSDVEKEALEKGWNPKGIPGKRHKSAEEFLATGELIEKLESASEENKKYRETVELMLQKMQTKEKTAYEKALRDIEAKREAAVVDGDVNRFNALEQEYKQIQEQVSTPDPAQSLIDKQVNDFVTRNAAWYNDQTFENSQMKKFAEEYEDFLAKKHPGLAIEDRFKEVETEVRRKFSDSKIFSNSRRNEAPKTSSTEVKREVKQTVDLSPQQEQMYRLIKRQDKNYTKEQYPS